MSLFDWKDDYSVEIAEIDEQHKSLIGLINRLYDAVIEEEMDKERLGPIFSEWRITPTPISKLKKIILLAGPILGRKNTD